MDGIKAGEEGGAAPIPADICQGTRKRVFWRIYDPIVGAPLAGALSIGKGAGYPIGGIVPPPL